mgnify:CR=1 FL=1
MKKFLPQKSACWKVFSLFFVRYLIKMTLLVCLNTFVYVIMYTELAAAAASGKESKEKGCQFHHFYNRHWLFDRLSVHFSSKIEKIDEN